MRWVALALVVACSPRENPEDKRVPPKPPRFAVDALVPTYSDDPPWDAAEIDAPVVETGPLTITPPQQPGAPPPAGVLAIARVPNGWRKVDVAALTVTGDSVAIPAGEPIEIADISRLATPAGVLVIAPAVSELDRDLGFALANECWTFATVDGGALVGAWPVPCPAVTPDGKPQVAVAILEKDKLVLGVTEPRDVFESTVELVAYKLRALKATKPFAKRTDLVYTTSAGVTIAALVPALAAIRATGFTGTRWVPPPWIPVRLGNEIGFEPPPPPPPQPPPGLMQPGPPIRQVTVTVGDVKLPKDASYTSDEIARVVKARAGVFRACYQKELNRTPGIKGTLTVSVIVEPDGVASKAASAGTLVNQPVVQCVQANVLRLKFLPKGTRTNFKVTMTFAST